jgi:hypothetical protein
MRGHKTKNGVGPGNEQPSQQERPRRGGWSDLGEVDLNTGVPAAGPVDPAAQQNASFPDGNNVVGTVSDTGVPTGLPFKSALKRRASKRKKTNTDPAVDDSKS